MPALWALLLVAQAALPAKAPGPQQQQSTPAKPQPTRAKPQSTPEKQHSAPATQQPAPATQQPAPSTQQSTPATQSTSETQQPAPSTQRPASATQSTPAAQQPASATQQPAPATQESTSATSQSPPATQQSAPVTQQSTSATQQSTSATQQPVAPEPPEQPEVPSPLAPSRAAQPLPPPAMKLSPGQAAAPENSGPPSKKQAWLADKATRHGVHLVQAPKLPASPCLTLHNVWTNESLPVVLAPAAKGALVPEPAAPFAELARDHYTNQAAPMDARLFATVVRAATQFHARYVEIVSGFRAPKYQLMLRKKGHEVARESQHPLGQAVDFRIPNVTTKQLLRWVRSLHLGGVGYYPESKFVHADVGRIRFWRGH